MQEDSQFNQYLKNIGEDFYYPVEIFGKSYMNVEKTDKLYTHIRELYNAIELIIYIEKFIMEFKNIEVLYREIRQIGIILKKIKKARLDKIS